MPSSNRILDAALAWQVTLWSKEVSTEDRARFERWLAGSADHRSAWEAVSLTDLRLSGLGRPEPALAALDASGRRRSRRRLLGALIGTALAGGAGGWLTLRSVGWPYLLADLRTGCGEHRQTVLDDGTSVRLGPYTALDVDFQPALRALTLLRGRIEVETGKDVGVAAMRPFEVTTPFGRARALGTRFSVRVFDDRALVAVEEGAVLLQTGSGVGEGVRLEAGQQASLARDGARRPEALVSATNSWTRGMLVADRLPLDAVLAELSLYRPGILRADAEAGALVVSGIYSLTDTDQTLKAFGRALPIEVDTRLPYWTTVRRR